MFENLKRLYLNGTATVNTINNAVVKGWITQAEADEIFASL